MAQLFLLLHIARSNARSRCDRAQIQFQQQSGALLWASHTGTRTIVTTHSTLTDDTGLLTAD
ncbi:MAG: hypothetical protein MUE44_31530 [Oscillatoriaceae cyanobacterium Prado104]|nr:hypothetical protein [Oscillatoriaceae cyanobacterium Prado104]